MVNTKFTKNTILAIFAILAVVVIIYFSASVLGINAHSLSNGFASQNCAYVGSNATASCASIVNGVVTSISSTQITSNYGPYNYPAYIVNFVLNGAGQSLTGTQTFSSQQVASLFNSSSQVSQNNQISITAKLNSQSLVFPYYYGGVTLQDLSIKTIVFPFSWFSNGAGTLTTCTQTVENSTNNYYAVACTGSYADLDLTQVLAAYNSTCASHFGKVFVNNSEPTPPNFQGSVASGWAYQCLNVTAAPADQVFYASSPNVATNASLTFSNGTLSKTLYLTNLVSQSSYGSVLNAQIYGYTTGALNTYLGTVAPIMLVSPDGSSKLVPYETVADVELMNELSGGCFQGSAAAIGGLPLTYVYAIPTLQTCIGTQNLNINQIESQNLQPTDSYSPMQTIGATGVMINYKGTYTGAQWYGILNVINNPVFYPEMQIIASQKTVGSLNVLVPVAYPYIQSYSPNPITIQSGSANMENFIVGNNASVTASAYIVVNALNGTTVAQSPDFSIPAHGTTSESLNLGAYNPGLANLATDFTATVYSAQQTAIFSSTILAVNIKPNCPTGTVYVNNSNCVAEGHSCDSGFGWNGIGCQSLCSPPAIWNLTSHTCWYVPPPPPKRTDWVLVLGIIGGIAAIGGGALYFGLRKRRRGSRSHRRKR